MDKIYKYIIATILWASVTILFFTLNKSFMSMNSFPLIFGLISAASTVIILILIKEKSWMILFMVFFSLGINLSLGAIETRVEEKHLKGIEAEAKSAIDNRSMPLESYTVLQGDSTIIAKSGELFPSRYTILNFWAPWCPPCLKEMPMLDEFYQKFKEKDIQIIGVTGLYREKDRDDDTKFLKWAKSIYEKDNISYPVIFDENGGNARKFKANSLPLTVLLDNQSRIIEYRIGIKGAKIIIERIRNDLNLNEPSEK